MARGMIRFYGHGTVTQPIGFTSQVLFRFGGEGYYDLDAVAVTPTVLSKLMRRFPYHNLDAQGQPTGDKMLNGVPFSGQTGGVKIIVNEAAMRPNQRNLHRHEDTQKEAEPVLTDAAHSDTDPAPTGKEPATSGKRIYTKADLAAAVTRKDLVNLAREMGVKLERADKSEDIRSRINKNLEG